MNVVLFMINLLFLQYRIIRNRIKALSFLDEVKIALFIFFGLFFLGGIYWGAWRLLDYLNSVQIVGPLLMNKLVAMVFLTSFTMVIFSSLITSFNTMYFSKDLPWLISKPLPLGTIFAFKSINTFVFSTWMVFVALAPFILALGQVKNVNFTFYLWLLALIIPFFAISNMVGISVSLFLMRFFPTRKTRDLLLLLSVVIITIVYMLFRFLQPERLVKPDGLEVVSQYIAYLDAPVAVYLPSWWITAGVFNIISGSYTELLFHFSLLLGVFIVLLIAVNALAQKFYFAGWADSKTYHTGALAARGRSFKARSPFRAFIVKDIRVFFRDASQWSQLLVLVALILIYIFSIYKLPLDSMYLQNLVAFFNMGLIGFMLSAVSLRFVFPCISLEGDNLWLLKSAPFRFSKLFWEKLIFSGLPVVVIGTVLSIGSGWLLKAETSMMLVLFASSLIMSVGLSVMAMSFGSIFPKFGINNIAEIESSSGGILYMITSLFYIGLNLGIWAIPVQLFYRHKFGGPAVPLSIYGWVALAAVVVNLAFILIPSMYALRKLEQIEA